MDVVPGVTTATSSILPDGVGPGRRLGSKSPSSSASWALGNVLNRFDPSPSIVSPYISYSIECLLEDCNCVTNSFYVVRSDKIPLSSLLSVVLKGPITFNFPILIVMSLGFGDLVPLTFSAIAPNICSV